MRRGCLIYGRAASVFIMAPIPYWCRTIGRVVCQTAEVISREAAIYTPCVTSCTTAAICGEISFSPTSL